MGPLFVLFIWAFLFGIILFPLGLIGIIIAHFYGKHKNVEVKKTAWFFAPTVLLFSFACLFFVENLFFSSIMGSSSALATDVESINLNKKYELYRIDVSDWRIGAKDSPVPLCTNILEIYNKNDTIVFSTREKGYYILAQLNNDKEEYAVIDSASTTIALWDKYTKARGIDKYEIYTCNRYYWRYRTIFGICALIFNIVLFIYIFRRFKEFWKSLLIDDF